MIRDSFRHFSQQPMDPRNSRVPGDTTYENLTQYQIDISLEMQSLNGFAGLDKPVKRAEK